MKQQYLSDESELDLTPMLDVVFIMLIFFIVTASFVDEIGIDLPGDNNKPMTKKATESLIIKITENNRYYVNRKHTDKRALLNYLSALHAEMPDRSLVVIPDLNASTDSLVHALDIGRILNVPMAISIPEQED